MGVDLVKVAGGMAAYGTDAAVVLPTLVRRALEAMERAVRFATTYRTAFGDLPRAEDMTLFEPTVERVLGAASSLDMSEHEAYGLVEAWFVGGEWVQPVLYLCQRKEVRSALPQRERLTSAIDAMCDHIGTARWLSGLLLVLDPPSCARSWNAGRVYPLMRPSLVVNRVLPADEAARWLREVRPDQSNTDRR
jgi:hypothetical protein